jgi:choline dehydrogenase
LKSNPELKASDLMIFSCQVPVGMPEIAEKYGPFGENAFCFLPALVNIKSRGHLKLRDANPDSPLEIQGNLLSEQEDIDAMVRAVEICTDIAEQPAFKKFIKRWIAPRKRLESRAEILDFIRESVTSYIHPVGTCKMGSDKDSVVSDRLLVHGLKGLRIADASIMPEVTSSNTQAPVLMIAEFASREILAGANQRA